MWKTILAAMLYLQTPGRSIYSQVPTTEDAPPTIMSTVNGVTAYRLLDDGEELPTQCIQDGNVGCIRPSQKVIVSNGEEIGRRWQRPETYDEGVNRYAVIAHAIDDVLSEGEWNFPVGLLSRYLLTVAYHESGFRRDVHTGIGPAAIGDCKRHRDRLVKGSCRSHGLFQTLFRDPKSTRVFGFAPSDIIGDDYTSTKRSAFVASKHLDRVYHYCRFRGPRPFRACIFASYGGTLTTRDPRVLMRVRTLNRLDAAPKNIDRYVQSLVGDNG